MTKYQFHPAADLFPLMSETELKELAEDIKTYGLRSPITRDKDGVILEGRNRLLACERIGATPRFETFTGEAVPFIISANIRRRHLTPAQKQELLIKVIALQPEKSNRQIGKTVGTDHKTVGAARKKGEDVGKIPHVAKHTDSKGRKQPVKAKPKAAVNPPAPPKADPSADALGQFKYACNTWLPKLNADDLKRAQEYCQTWKRANGSAEISAEERKAAHAKLDSVH
jgi:hypothetical protein